MEAKANNGQMINCANCIINSENYSHCCEFQRYTARLRKFWNQYHLDNYTAVFEKKVATNSDQVFTLLVTINLLDSQTLESLQRKTGTEPWLDAIESFEEAVKDLHEEIIESSDTCFTLGITTHTGDSQEELDEAEISASTIHLFLNIIK